MKKVITFILILLLTLGALLYFPEVNDRPMDVQGKTITVNDDGGATYTSIQAAIDSATPGDTIKVWDGTYHENLVVDKTITLKGNSTTKTTINSTGGGNGIYITADWVNISGFKILNTSIFGNAGIKLYGVSNCRITNNNCSDNRNGITLDASNFNIIKNNICYSNREGIYIVGSSKLNIITENFFIENGNRGIKINDGSDSNIIANNTCLNNDCGIQISSSDYNYLYHNNMISNTQQIDESGINYWNNSHQEGNFWTDYSGLDDGTGGRVAGDGIGDTDIPHLGVDDHPFIFESGWRPPQAPTLKNPGVNDSNGSYKISWFQSLRCDKYVLHEDTNISFGSPLKLYEGKDTMVSISQRVNHTYFYRVSGINLTYNMTSAWSNIESIIVDWLPDTPENFTVSALPQGNAINISWDQNLVDCPKYHIENKNGTTLWTPLTIVIASKHWFIHSDLKDGVRCYYRIRGCDLRGQFSEYSNTINTVPRDSKAPAAPPGFNIHQIGYNFINLTWLPSADHDTSGYSIYRQTTTSAKHLATTTNTWYNDSSVQESKPYYYNITAFDEVPNHSQSSMIIGPVYLPIIPAVTFNEPAAGAKNVSIMTEILVTFSKPMNTTSVRSAFEIIPVIKGTFKWSDENTNLVFSPVVYIEESTLYTITITTDAKDISANALISPYTWNFTTGQDITQPSVKSHFPSGINISIATNISIRFSEKMNKLSVKNAIEITPEVTGAVKWVENACIFTPDNFLKFNTKYDILIKASAKDLAGNPLESEFGWNFTTVSEESSPPLIVDHSPTGNNVPLDVNVRIEFVKPMDHSITEKAFSIFPDVDGTEFSWESNTMVFSHSSKFEYYTRYNVTLTTAAIDIWDNHLEQNFSWEFTTEPKAVIKILELSPQPGEIAEIDENINIIFSKAVTISLVNLSVENITGGQVNGTVNYDGEKNELVFRLTDDVYYDYNSTYFVTLSGIKFDITGFNIVENGSIYTWSFTTKSEADADTDGDGMNDKWENIHGLDRFNNTDMNGDPDEDGLMNFEEHNEKTDPMDADSDDDGLNDSAEISIYKTDPLNPDSDGDGHSDGDEVLANTDPNDITDHPKAGEKGGTSKEDYTYIIAAIMIIVVILILLFLFVHRKRAKNEDEKVEDWKDDKDNDKKIDKVEAETDADEKDYGEWKVVDDDLEAEYSVGPRKGGPRQMRMSLGSKHYKPKRGKVELGKDKIPGKKGTMPEKAKGSSKVSRFGRGKGKGSEKPPENPPKLHITDTSVRCNICLGNVKTGLSVITCSCGKHYHEKCGHRIGICPSCDTNLDKLENKIAENDR